MIIGVDIREWQVGCRTGIGRYLEEFIRTAAAARPADRFVLFGDTKVEARVQAANIDIIRIPEYWSVWWDQVSLPRALARYHADVLFSPYIKIPVIAPVPVVSTIHDLTFFLAARYNRGVLDLVLNIPFRLFCLLVTKRAAAIVVDSATSAGDVRLLLGPDPVRLHVIPLGVPERFLASTSPDDDKVWSRYGLRPGYVFYVGGFWPHKNVPCLIGAYMELRKPLRDCYPLVLVGGPLTPPVARQLSLPGTSAAVRYLGVVPDEDLPALYRGAALFAFPSHYEGFGLPVLEALACGVPVLSSTAPALVELAGEAAEYADPDEESAWQIALSELLENSSRRADLGAKGHLRAMAYSQYRMTMEILRILDEVVDQHTSQMEKT